MQEEQVQESDKKQALTIKHRLSKQFVSQYASGAIVAGPGPNDMYTIMFYADAFGVEYEGLEPIEDEPDRYQVVQDPEGCGYFREDQARITVSRETLEAIYKAIGSRLTKTSDTERNE